MIKQKINQKDKNLLFVAILAGMGGGILSSLLVASFFEAFLMDTQNKILIFVIALIAFFDSYLCLVCNRASFDGKTHPGCITRFSIDGATASIVYKGVVKKLLYQFKYQPNLTDLRSVLSELF